MKDTTPTHSPEQRIRAQGAASGFKNNVMSNQITGFGRPEMFALENTLGIDCGSACFGRAISDKHIVRLREIASKLAAAKQGKTKDVTVLVSSDANRGVRAMRVTLCADGDTTVRKFGQLTVRGSLNALRETYGKSNVTVHDSAEITVKGLKADARWSKQYGVSLVTPKAPKAVKPTAKPAAAAPKLTAKPAKK